jgi:hypothetical protein
MDLIVVWHNGLSMIRYGVLELHEGLRENDNTIIPLNSYGELHSYHTSVIIRSLNG